MTIKELKEQIQNLPDNMIVLVNTDNGECGDMSDHPSVYAGYFDRYESTEVYNMEYVEGKEFPKDKEGKDCVPCLGFYP